MAWDLVPDAFFAEGLGANGGDSSEVDSTGANRGVLVVGHLGTGLAVSDTLLNTWDLVRQQDQGIGYYLSIYRTADGSVFGAGHGISAVLSGGLVGAAAAFFSGGALISIDDQQNGAGGLFGAPLLTGEIEPSEDNTLIVTGASTSDGGDPDTIDSGFTLIAHEPAGSSFGIAIAYLVQPTAAPVNPEWQFTTGSYQVAGIANFKAASGEAPPSSNARVEKYPKGRPSPFEPMHQQSFRGRGFRQFNRSESGLYVPRDDRYSIRRAA
jgi:hypothetical protein